MAICRCLQYLGLVPYPRAAAQFAKLCNSAFQSLTSIPSHWALQIKSHPWNPDIYHRALIHICLQISLPLVLVLVENLVSVLRGTNHHVLGWPPYLFRSVELGIQPVRSHHGKKLALVMSK
jgi:hypothetical protein